MKPGDVRWRAWIDCETGKIDFDEYVLRSKSRRKKYNGLVWFGGPVTVYYWVIREKYVTWGKLSNKHGDWGWLSNFSDIYRRSHTENQKPPGRPTKLGALIALRAETKRYEKYLEDDELPLDVLLKKIDAQIKRKRGKQR